MKQLDGTVVHVKIELESGAEENVARVPVVGHARIAERTDEDRIELAQQVVPVRRDRDTGFEEVIRAPRQLLEVERPPEPLADRAQHFHRFGGDLFADAVTGDKGDVSRFFQVTGFKGSTGF